MSNVKELLTKTVRALNERLKERHSDDFNKFKYDFMSVGQVDLYEDGYDDGYNQGRLELAEKVLIMLEKKYEG